MIDPVVLATIVSVLGPALNKVLEKLADKGIVEPVLEPLTKQIKKWATGDYDKKKADADLLKVLQASLPSDADNLKLALVLSDLKSKSNLAEKVAAVAIEMTSDDANRLPPKLIQELGLDDSQRRPLAVALFNLRKNLAKNETYRAGIDYADALEVKHQLAGLVEAVEGLGATVVESKDGKAVRVVLATPPPDQRALPDELKKRKFGLYALQRR